MDISTAVRAGETPGCSNTPSLSPDQNTSMFRFDHRRRNVLTIHIISFIMSLTNHLKLRKGKELCNL